MESEIAARFKKSYSELQQVIRLLSFIIT